MTLAIIRVAHSVDKTDISRLGKSRIARKLRRKAIDAHLKGRRAAMGEHPKSGPPIPRSEHSGQRQYYTLAQAQHGGRRSGAVRRSKAQRKWNEVLALHKRGFGIRQIARLVSYSAG